MDKGPPVEELSFAETLAEAARYVTSSEDEDDDEEEEIVDRPSAAPGPSMPRQLVSRAAIEETVKMKQVRSSHEYFVLSMFVCMIFCIRTCILLD